MGPQVASSVAVISFAQNPSNCYNLHTFYYLKTPEMSERIEDIIEFRKKKLQNFIDAGIDPYPSSTQRTHTNAEALENFDQIAESAEVITVVGRIRSLRNQGKIAFAHIEDGTAKIQIFFKKDNLADTFQWLDNFDLGDFIEATGTLFNTKTGEKTLEVKGFRMLSKSLRPLPSEFYGLENQEIRLRKRYLDLIMNPETRELFQKKAKFWLAMQKFLVDRGFMPVENPALESVPGGAEAEPFITHHNALDRDFYLRISLELPLKKLIVGGYEKVFEIGRIFRNEGISTEHLQDYTQMEFYWAYADFEMLMKFTQEMYQYVIKETFGTLQIPYQGEIIDWSGNWPRQDYFELFEKHTGLDLNTATEQELKSYASENNISYEDFAGRGRVIDLIFKKKIRIRPDVAMQPSFLINQPIEIEPLAKRDSENPKVVQRMQILACGSELGKGFGELNDPIDQRGRFQAQMDLREKGDNEAQMIDEDYLEAMEYGMPPLAGFGLSERLFAVLNDKSIRETVIFPPMKD
jgi:lysyl-tRNA synthetase, class II